MTRSLLASCCLAIASFAFVAGCKSNDDMNMKPSMSQNDLRVRGEKMSNDGKTMMDKGKAQNDMQMQRDGQVMMEKGEMMKKDALKKM